MPISQQQIEHMPGAKQLVDWFGHWPSFHDAEVLEVHLARNGESWLKIHTWAVSDTLDSRGCYEQDKHVIVTFRLTDIYELELHDFNHQNVIQELELEMVNAGTKLALVDSFGLAGSVIAKNISVEVSPGKPE